MIDFHGELSPEFGFNKESFSVWIKKIAQHFHKEIIELNIHFLSDDELLQINQEHLNHDYYTDIITFDYCIDNQLISDIFISYDRVKENAVNEKQTPSNEIKRVIAHGILHLVGYKDKTNEEVAEMRKQEDFCISLH